MRVVLIPFVAQIAGLMEMGASSCPLTHLKVYVVFFKVFYLFLFLKGVLHFTFTIPFDSGKMASLFTDKSTYAIIDKIFHRVLTYHFTDVTELLYISTCIIAA